MIRQFTLLLCIAALSAAALSYGEEPAAPVHELKLFLDRAVYDAVDVNGQAAAQVLGPKDGEVAQAVDFSLLHDGKVIGQGRVETGRIATPWRFDVSRLTPGAYELHARSLLNDQPVAEAKQAFAVRPTPERPALPRTVAFAMPSRNVGRNRRWPVRTGLAIPRGMLSDGDPVTLLEDGREIPCQTDVRGRWSSGGSIRWLGLTFVSTCLNGRPPKYELVLGRKPQAAPVGVTASEEAGRVTVDAGALRFVVGRNGLDSAWFGVNADGVLDENELACGPAEGSGPYVVDDQGTRYNAAADAEAEVSVVESGPVYAAVRVAGWFVDAEGKRFCKYTTWYEAYAGLPYVFVNHAVVLTFNTAKAGLKDAGVAFGLKGDRYALGVDRQETRAVRRSGRVFLLQDRYDHCVFSANGKQSEGRRASGWVDVAGRNGPATTLITTHMPERFPKQLTLDESVATFHLWPPDVGDTFSDEEELARNRIYTVLYAHEGPTLRMQLPENYVERLREYCSEHDFSYVKAGTESNGMGAAINESFVVAFRRGRDFVSTELDDLSDLAKLNPHAVADPEWTGETGVFGPTGFADPSHAVNAERMLIDNLVASGRLFERINSEYGMWIFGGTHYYWRPEENCAALYRVWQNVHYGSADLAWLEYARSGDGDLLRWARDHSHNSMNVGMCHYRDGNDPLAYTARGLIYHAKGFVPWGGDGHFARHYTWTAFLLYDWLMTGNRRAHDVAEEWHEGVLRADTNFHARTDRERITPLGELLAYHRNDHDPRDLPAIHDMASIFLNVPAREWHWLARWHPLALIDYHGLTRNKRALERIIEFGSREDRYGKYPCRYLLDYAYMISGNRDYLWPAPNLYALEYDGNVDPCSPANGLTGVVVAPAMSRGISSLITLTALRKAGLPVDPPFAIPAPPIEYEHNRICAAFEKADGKEARITIDAKHRFATRKVTVWDGRGEKVETRRETTPEAVVTVVPADAPAGIYRFIWDAELHKVMDLVDGVNEFTYLEAGHEYILGPNWSGGLLVWTVRPVEPGKDITFRIVLKHAAVGAAVLLGPDNRELDVVRIPIATYPRQATVTVPAEGGPYRLVFAGTKTYVTVDRDVIVDNDPTY